MKRVNRKALYRGGAGSGSQPLRVKHPGLTWVAAGDCYVTHSGWLREETVTGKEGISNYKRASQ